MLNLTKLQPMQKLKRSKSDIQSRWQLYCPVKEIIQNFHFVRVSSVFHEDRMVLTVVATAFNSLVNCKITKHVVSALLVLWLSRII